MYKAFLANSSNNQTLIRLLAEYMANVDITVQYAEGDSDYKICVPWPAGQHKLNQQVLSQTIRIFFNS